MKRTDAREKLMIGLYQHLLVSKELSDVLDELKTTDEATNNYYYDICEVLINEEENFINETNKSLQDYSFDRLGYCEQAILLISKAELSLDFPVEVSINEAIKLAKKYCDDEAYKIINAVLDKK